MTTPIDSSSSPFIGNTTVNSANKNSKETLTDTEEFSIHTMEDDLLDLQKIAEPTKKVEGADVPKKITPTKVATPVSEPKKVVFDPKDLSSSVVHPISEKNIRPISAFFSVPPQKNVSVPVPVSNQPKKNPPQDNSTPLKTSFFARFNFFGKKLTKEEKLAKETKELQEKQAQVNKKMEEERAALAANKKTEMEYKKTEEETAALANKKAEEEKRFDMIKKEEQRLVEELRASEEQRKIFAKKMEEESSNKQRLIDEARALQEKQAQVNKKMEEKPVIINTMNNEIKPEYKKTTEKPAFSFFNQNVVSKKKELIEVPLPEKKAVPINTRKVILSTAIAIVVIILVSGGYYFLFGRPPKQVAIPEPTPIQPEEPPVIEKYSAEKPNPLSLDITTLSSEDIGKAIKGVAEELSLVSKKHGPYEFIVVDANNNPVTFPLFATAAKINLSPEILKNLGESFSLFLYNDNGNERLSVATDIKDKKLLTTELQKQEKTFIVDAAFLFLDEKPEITTGLFQDSTHANIPIRFFNVNSQITMSIDYAFVNDRLVIATSKKTMRAIIDKLTVTTTSTTNTVEPAQEKRPSDTKTEVSDKNSPSASE